MSTSRGDRAASDAAYYLLRTKDQVRAARWRAQKRQWWRNHRARAPVQVRVTP